MTSVLLKCKSFVPPLLESQISPPYRIISKHLQYLQKWREYLYWCFTEYQFDKKTCIDIQKAVDESIKIILLIKIIRQYDEFAVWPGR